MLGPSKTIALRDFYRVEGEKLGEFQSTGMTANYGYTLYALRLMFDQSMFRKIPLLRQFLRIPAYIAQKLLGEATIFATIVEDFPYHENRIALDSISPSGIRVHYNISNELRARNHRMRRLLGQALRSFRILPLNVDLTLNYGHPCGTCKAGLSPSDSVLDKNCKAHGIENLYVADSSFMPTSGGTNPSLTIAANALRVAEAIHESL
jgi:choline dehydrogenase-like flavoprotein